MVEETLHRQPHTELEYWIFQLFGNAARAQARDIRAGLCRP